MHESRARGVNMTFYDIDGQPIDKQSFIQKYNAYYYTGLSHKNYFYANHDDYVIVPKNSPAAEIYMEHLLYKGCETYIDVCNVLAWKFGMIDYEETEKRNIIVWKSGWKTKNYAKTCWGKIFNIQKVAEVVLEINRKPFLDDQKIIDIMGTEFRYENGIGPTYMLTLLYFIRHGQFPIYDQFADRAVQAIMCGVKPANTIERMIVLPAKTEPAFNELIKQLNPFKTIIEVLFGEEYYLSRNIDRALWVYGHAKKEWKYN